MKTARCQLGVTFEIFFIRLIQIPFPHNPIIFPLSNIGIVQTYTISYNLRQCVITPPSPPPSSMYTCKIKILLPSKPFLSFLGCPTGNIFASMTGGHLETVLLAQNTVV